jgi:hypothetical protein
MQEEYNSLIENNTWTLCQLPQGRKAIKNKWVFKTKLDANGNVSRYKARLVVKGCSQKYGIDYQEIFSPVIRYQTVRYLIALSVQMDLQINQMDAVTAFLQGELNQEIIYMEQPQGFINNKNLVCKLNKALYGLKQSSRVWNLKLDAALKKFGCNQSQLDPCLYFIKQNNKILFVTIYVDDFLIFWNNEDLFNSFKQFLLSNFKMKDLGVAEYCLGIRISRNFQKGKLWLDQEQYTKKILEKFNMENSKPVKTPLNTSCKFTENSPPIDESKIPYREAIGSLLFLAQISRPDIAFAVHKVSQYCNKPSQEHWNAVKWIFRYLRGTMNMKLEYSKTGSDYIIGYSDADWGGSNQRHSTSGYIFQMAGGPISWKSQKQSTIALSTCEAEYIALSSATQEAVWYYNLQKELNESRAIPINVDNQSAIQIAENNAYSSRCKHIDIRYHFIRDILRKQIINLNYISTDKQTADIFTKGLQAVKQKIMIQLLGLVHIY